MLGDLASQQPSCLSGHALVCRLMTESMVPQPSILASLPHAQSVLPTPADAAHEQLQPSSHMQVRSV